MTFVYPRFALSALRLAGSGDASLSVTGASAAGGGCSNRSFRETRRMEIDGPDHPSVADVARLNFYEVRAAATNATTRPSEHSSRTIRILSVELAW